jgi:hypothetical protein
MLDYSRNMNDNLLPAIRDYRIYFNDGRELEVRDRSGDLEYLDFIQQIYTGKVPVYGHDGKIAPVTEQNTKQIIPFIAQICANCLEKLNLHPGANFCPKCEMSTWVPAQEV